MITRSGVTRSLTGGYQRTPRSSPAPFDMASMGRGGDTELAHVNPQEASVLKAMGGSGTINPRTGLREYLGGGPGSQSQSETGARASEGVAGAFGVSGSGGSRVRGGGDDLFADASAFRDALAASQGTGGGSVTPAGGFYSGLNPEMGPAARAGRNFIEGAQPTGMHKAVAFGIGAALPFGIDASARADYITGQPALDLTWSPMQAMANMTPLGPLGDMAPEWGQMDIASVPFSGSPQTGPGDTGGGRAMQEQIDSLVRSVLRPPEQQAAAADSPAPADNRSPRRYVPFEGNPHRYGMAGGAPSHEFFQASS